MLNELSGLIMSFKFQDEFSLLTTEDGGHLF